MNHSNLTYKYFILSASIMLTFFSFGQDVNIKKELNSILVTVNFDYWERCETGKGECKPFTIERDKNDNSILIYMPCGGTFTTVVLVESGEEPFNDSPLRKISIEHKDCPPVFDISNLPDGDYMLYMTACGLGGAVNFKLKTKRE